MALIVCNCVVPKMRRRHYRDSSMRIFFLINHFYLFLPYKNKYAVLCILLCPKNPLLSNLLNDTQCIIYKYFNSSWIRFGVISVQCCFKYEYKVSVVRRLVSDIKVQIYLIMVYDIKSIYSGQKIIMFKLSFLCMFFHLELQWRTRNLQGTLNLY